MQLHAADLINETHMAPVMMFILSLSMKVLRKRLKPLRRKMSEPSTKRLRTVLSSRGKQSRTAITRISVLVTLLARGSRLQKIVCLLQLLGVMRFLTCCKDQARAARLHSLRYTDGASIFTVLFRQSLRALYIKSVLL